MKVWYLWIFLLAFSSICSFRQLNGIWGRGDPPPDILETTWSVTMKFSQNVKFDMEARSHKKSWLNIFGAYSIRPSECQICSHYPTLTYSFGYYFYPTYPFFTALLLQVHLLGRWCSWKTSCSWSGSRAASGCTFMVIFCIGTLFYLIQKNRLLQALRANVFPQAVVLLIT